jgi:hypothetical protein
LIKDFHEEFDTIPEAKKYVIRHKLSITWEQLVFAWDMLGDMASLRDNLHGYGESFNKWGMQAPDLAKTRFVEDHKELTSKYVLAKRASSILSRA